MPEISSILLILLEMSRPERFELPTAWFVAIYSKSN